MDEQLAMASEPEQSGTYDAGIDESAYEDYDMDGYSEPDMPEEDYSEPVTSGDGNITMNEDGELELSDEFFANTINDEPIPPKMYTPEELQATPFEYWDVNRIEGDVKDYIPIVRDQMMRRQMEQQMAMRPETPPIENAPRQYTPAELAQAAQELACEKLGLDDPDDFDEYESEHQAALNLAMQELSQQRNAEVAQYQRVARDYQDLQRFNAELVRQPDYAEFDRWFSGKLQEAGVTAQQVNAGLQEYARRSGGDYGALRGVISGWYQEFRQERAGNSMMRGGNRGNRPPVLEGSGSTGYEGRRSMNMRNFGNLDPDAQAMALIRMGIV
ncbi:MAG: hypothetical protein IJS39_14445 [Synergistaceae bacterium]|nr:hypothetical protein [Synergistaceae bacterium]